MTPDAALPIEQAVARPVDQRFAHASEAEMARILDFYAVRWEYEPDTFPIRFNLDGDVVESFSPDFWLPDLDLYLEITTLRQKLVRKKNRKLRRLRELYPDVRVKLFYARDFRQLMLKYGKLALVDSISGTPGQVVPERPEPSIRPDAPSLAGPHAAPTAGPTPVRTRRRRRSGTASAARAASTPHAGAPAGTPSTVSAAAATQPGDATR